MMVTCDTLRWSLFRDGNLEKTVELHTSDLCISQNVIKFFFHLGKNKGGVESEREKEICEG